MNTILKRKISSVIATDSIAKNIGSISNISNISNNKKCKKHKIKIKPAKATDTSTSSKNKRQKKSHYNDKMQPINISTSGVAASVVGAALPKRIREVVWNTYNGETYSSKCYVPWCNNTINVFNYQVGHDIPDSKGGTYDISNLRPICSNCNLSMGNRWTIQEWNKLVIQSPTNYTVCDNQTMQTTDKDDKKEQQSENINEKTNTNENIESYGLTLQTTNKIAFLTCIFLAVNLLLF